MMTSGKLRHLRLLVILSAAAGVCLAGASADAADAAVDAADYASINAAVAALPATGGEVYVPAGEHRIAQTILLPDNVTLRGAGDSTLIVAGPELDAFFTAEDAFGEASDVAILFTPSWRHGAVIKNADAAGNRGIRVEHLRITTDRSRVRLATGILLANVDDASISGVTVEDCGASAITMLDCRNCRVTASTIRRNHNGVFIRGAGATSHDFWVTDNTVDSNRWSGIYLSGLGAGTDRLTDGPENVTISGNHISNHMCDTAIKLHGPRYVFVTGNRIDRALEAGMECNGGLDVVCTGNIVTRVDDGMDLKGNGVGLSFGRQMQRADLVLNANITAECGVGIWSETIHQTAEGARQGAVGGVAVTGNIARSNIAYGMGGAGITDCVWVGNVSIDNGQHDAPAGQDTAGMLFTAGCRDGVVAANVIADQTPEDERLMQSGIIIRSTTDFLNALNSVQGATGENLNLYSNQEVHSLDNMVDGQITQ